MNLTGSTSLYRENTTTHVDAQRAQLPVRRLETRLILPPRTLHLLDLLHIFCERSPATRAVVASKTHRMRVARFMESKEPAIEVAIN